MKLFYRIPAKTFNNLPTQVREYLIHAELVDERGNPILATEKDFQKVLSQTTSQQIKQMLGEDSYDIVYSFYDIDQNLTRGSNWNHGRRYTYGTNDGFKDWLEKQKWYAPRKLVLMAMRSEYISHRPGASLYPKYAYFRIVSFNPKTRALESPDWISKEAFYNQEWDKADNFEKWGLDDFMDDISQNHDYMLEYFKEPYKGR